MQYIMACMSDATALFAVYHPPPRHRSRLRDAGLPDLRKVQGQQTGAALRVRVGARVTDLRQVQGQQAGAARDGTALALTLTLTPTLTLTLTLTPTLTLALTLALALTRRSSRRRSRRRSARRCRCCLPRWAASQHAQTGPLAAPRLDPCASLGCACRLWAAQHSQGERPGYSDPSTCLGCSSQPHPKPPITFPRL